MAAFRAQHRPRVHPGRGDALRIQKGGTQRCGQQFTHGHHPGANPVAQFARLRDGIRHSHEGIDESAVTRIERDRQCSGQVAMAAIDLFQDRRLRTGQRRREQRVEPVGDARQRGMHHDRAQTDGHARAQHSSNVVPVRG